MDAREVRGLLLTHRWMALSWARNEPTAMALSRSLVRSSSRARNSLPAAPVRSPGKERELLGVPASEQSSRGVAGSSGSTWGTVGYLHGIRKTDISRALAKNRSVHPAAADAPTRRADGERNRRALVMAGELDLAASVCVHECMRLAQDRAETVVCDLGALSFIDVSGVRVLVDAADYARGWDASGHRQRSAGRIARSGSAVARRATRNGTAARGLRWT